MYIDESIKAFTATCANSAGPKFFPSFSFYRNGYLAGEDFPLQDSQE